MEILAVENLTFTYPLCKSAALSGVSFTAEKGEFITVCGATGSGKSTLLRMLKRELIPMGEMTGEVRFCEKPISLLDDYTSACSIGFVMQRPEQQLVTDKVWHELAFGLENMGLEQNIIRRRVCEMASYFGIEEWFDKDVDELSGGQKQLLNLASVMVMQPEILILDEPTAQLDPIAAADFLATIQKLNRDLSLTVIIVEHRLEEIIPCCDKLLVLDGGKITHFGKPREVIANLKNNSRLLQAMPAAVRLFSCFDIDAPCPVTVSEGRRFIESNFTNSIKSLDIPEYIHESERALEFSGVYFKYSRTSPDILCGASFTVYRNEIFCILGSNGCGKTTALLNAAGLCRAYGGTVKVFGKRLKEYKNSELYRRCLTMLPQDVQTVFLKNTVREELESSGTPAGELPYDLSGVLDRHPYDLSGGEQQLVALAKALASSPRLLLLDEPTKGLDADAKSRLSSVFKRLKAQGMTIVIVTHDIEFAASCADRCAMLFRGEITSCDTPAAFFAENSFYTTAANLMTRSYYDNVVTVEDAAELCRRNGGEQ